MPYARCPRCPAVKHLSVSDLEEWLRHFASKLLPDGLSIPLDQCPRCGLGGERHRDRGGYFNRELAGRGDAPPDMGRFCEPCGVRIPHFLELSGPVESRARSLARFKERLPSAIAEIVSVTGCPESWARIWAEHPNGDPHVAHLYDGPPWPQCGKPLRTKLAKQCVECGSDCHEREYVK